MVKMLMRRSEYIYALILQLYPKTHRRDFGKEMKYVFSESLKEAYNENREQGIISFWMRTLTDAGKSIFLEHLENKRGGVDMKRINKDIFMQDKIFLVIGIATTLILMIPLIAMQFTRDVDWKLPDFLIMGTLLFGGGSIFVIIARRVNIKNRLVIAILFLIAIFLIWVHLAVGIVDTWPFAGS